MPHYYPPTHGHHFHPSSPDYYLPTPIYPGPEPIYSITPIPIPVSFPAFAPEDVTVPMDISPVPSSEVIIPPLVPEGQYDYNQYPPQKNNPQNYYNEEDYLYNPDEKDQGYSDGQTGNYNVQGQNYNYGEQGYGNNNSGKGYGSGNNNQEYNSGDNQGYGSGNNNQEYNSGDNQGYGSGNNQNNNSPELPYNIS